MNKEEFSKWALATVNDLVSDFVSKQINLPLVAQAFVSTVFINYNKPPEKMFAATTEYAANLAVDNKSKFAHDDFELLCGLCGIYSGAVTPEFISGTEEELKTLDGFLLSPPSGSSKEFLSRYLVAVEVLKLAWHYVNCKRTSGKDASAFQNRCDLFLTACLASAGLDNTMKIPVSMKGKEEQMKVGCMSMIILSLSVAYLVCGLIF